MKSLSLYLVQVIICTGLLYGYYHFFLRNRKFHQYNRYYLLAIVVTSVILPFLQIPIYLNNAETKPILLQSLTSISPNPFEEDVVLAGVTEQQSWFKFTSIISLVYILIAASLFGRFLLALFRIARMITTYPRENLGNIQFINTTDPATPFSFFRWLFWNNKIELNSDNGQQIFRHELFHIRQKHSWDTIILEIITIIFWMNPFFHFLKKEIKAIHEFLADKFAVEEHKEWDYAELLLMQVLGAPNTRLTNPFFHNQIKRRIEMLTNAQRPGAQYLRKIMVLPLAVIVILLFAFTYKNRGDKNSILPAKQITIVVDAGHGGSDPGAWSTDKKESEAAISLQIAQQIQQLAGDYHVSVVLTRDDEKFPNGAMDKNEALRKRVEMANKINPTAFLSIHLNTTPDGKEQHSASGFEAYISKSRNSENDRMLASAVLQNLSSIYKTNAEAKLRNSEGIYVLDKNLAPSILLQCGFINNADDLAFVKNENNQQKIARSILEGIVKYYNATNSKPTHPPLMDDTVPKPKDDNKIFEKLEVAPSFPGGGSAWNNYLNKHIDSDRPIEKGAPAGEYSVLIQFIVDKEGNISDIKPLTKHGYGME